MELTPADLWSRILDSARTMMPEQSYRTWLAGSEAVGLTPDELVIEAATEFHAHWVEDKYGSALEEIAARVLGRPLRLSFRSARSEEPRGPSGAERAGTDRSGEPVPAATQAAGSPRPGRSADGRPAPGTSGAPARPTGSPGASPNLRERYTFDRFVVGGNNQLAAAASRAVAEKPARTYNPLFLYGGVGLGKTHLMHAVGHEVLARNSGTRVTYITTEQFTNDLVNAIQHSTTPDFRRRYRQIDLLLVDDIQFLMNKESTQEEFFHTFNALYDAGKQIVITSDRPPKDLPDVEERLVSRFEWGLVADVTAPDYETRVAILRKRAADDQLTLDDDVMDFIARSCTASVRELEGAVIKLLAYSSLRREEVTVELARKALHGTVRTGSGPGPGGLTADAIRDRVATEWNVRPDALSSKRRTRDLTVPRQVAMYLIKELLDESLVRIGRGFGGRDHSTVIHSIRKVEQSMAADRTFADRVQRLRAVLERDAR